jgi:IclR family mhp operon transcriptional activator
MASFPPVEAAVRTLTLLELLNREPVTTVASLHAATGIPKPSIVRLLQTLESTGYVGRGGAPGSYRLTAKVRMLASGYHSVPRTVEVVAPLLEDLTAAIKWPAALAMPEAGAMTVRYSTIASSPLSLRHSTINMRLSLASRALGRAYLAFCDDEERETLLRLLAQSADAEDALAQDRATLDAVIETVRRQGYALRDVSVRPVSNTLAVPVFDARRVIGAIGLTWFSSTMPPDEAVRRYLAPLMHVATQARLALSSDG